MIRWLIYIAVLGLLLSGTDNFAHLGGLVTGTFANLILLEATLSFLGLGVQPPFPSWGMMLSDARAYLLTDWQLSVYPGVAIMLTVMAANLLGDGLRDALDPRGD